MIYRLDNCYDARRNSVYTQVGLQEWGKASLRLGEGRRLHDEWQPLALKQYPKEGGLPDLAMMTGYALIGTERAWAKILPLVGEAVEPLPLGPGDPQYLALNVVNVVDALDPERSRRFMSNPSGARPHFVESRLRGHIFKVARTRLSPVFVSEELKRHVEAAGLVGLSFVPVDGSAKPASKPKTKAKTAPKALPRTKAEGVISEAPIEEPMATELQTQARSGAGLAGCDPTDEPDQIVKAILDCSETLRAGRKGRPKHAALALACLWGEQVCRRLGWSWAQLSPGGGPPAIGIVSPKRHFVVLPLPYITNILDNRDADNTVLLLFNMLVAGNTPKARARQYMPLG